MPTPDFRLVAIDPEGSPIEPLVLTEVAASVCDGNAAFFATVGYERPWVSYLAVANDAADTLLGTCAFKGPPQGNEGKREAEIAYYTFEEFEGQGIGGAMAAALVGLSRATDAGVHLIAHTLPETNASTHILTRLGFEQRGTGTDEEVGEVWRWELPQ